MPSGTSRPSSSAAAGDEEGSGGSARRLAKPAKRRNLRAHRPFQADARYSKASSSTRRSVPRAGALQAKEVKKEAKEEGAKKRRSVSRCSSRPSPCRLVPRRVVPRGSVALAIRKRPATATTPSSSESESARWMDKQWSDVWHDLDGTEWHLNALVWDNGVVRETWKQWNPET